MTDINISGFSGANNVKKDERFFVKKGIAEPRLLLNCDVDQTGKLIARVGKTLLINLPGAHSLWAGNTCCLCVANNVLYRIVNGVATSVGAVSGPNSPFSYVDAEDRVFIGNKYWQGIFDPSSNAVLVWGVPLPPGPTLLTGDGDLPAGTYNICFTNVVNGELSGNGQIASITLTDIGGIQVLSRPSGALVWCTEANEPIFYLVGAANKIVSISRVEPLPSFLCGPPPFMENLCYAFGRMWGSVGPDVFYSQPFKLGWYRLASNKFSYASDVTLIAKVPTGLYVGTIESTKFLAGTDPKTMQEMDAGAGAIKGTLAYCNNMPELGWTLGTPEKDFVDVPVWLTTEGVVVGSPTGKFFNITKNKIKMSAPSQGASLYRNIAGFIQFLTSFKTGGVVGAGAGLNDPDTYNAFKDGRIELYSKFLDSTSGRMAFSDDASCTVTRGGVEI
jgi:hypothetical protein